jgi:hypothetical protein
VAGKALVGELLIGFEEIVDDNGTFWAMGVMTQILLI